MPFPIVNFAGCALKKSNTKHSYIVLGGGGFTTDSAAEVTFDSHGYKWKPVDPPQTFLSGTILVQKFKLKDPPPAAPPEGREIVPVSGGDDLGQITVTVTNPGPPFPTSASIALWVVHEEV